MPRASSRVTISLAIQKSLRASPRGSMAGWIRLRQGALASSETSRRKWFNCIQAD